MSREHDQIEKKISDLEDLCRAASIERDQLKQQYISLLVDIIELAKVDNGALLLLVQWIRSPNATRETLNNLVIRWIESQGKFELFSVWYFTTI